MSDDDQQTPEDSAPDESWEAWAKVSMAAAILMVIMWIVVLARLGITSVKVHAFVPYLGAATLIVLAWGLVRTLLNPPVLRRSRTIAFFTLLGTGYVGTEPIIPAPLATEDYESELAYTLPVRGEWLVLAGGRDREYNYHATFPPVRWGYDFTKLEDGKKFALDGKRSEDWHCFGEPVYAPVAGTIVEMDNQHVDNNPGEVSPSSMLGNHIVIEAAPAEFVYLAHLQKASIPVAVGDVVASGDLLGKCGSSGQSPEPHLHMHVQDRLGFPIAQGVPIELSNYRVVDGKSEDRGMPLGSTSWDALDGQVVSAE